MYLLTGARPRARAARAGRADTGGALRGRHQECRGGARYEERCLMFLDIGCYFMVFGARYNDMILDSENVMLWQWLTLDTQLTVQ